VEKNEALALCDRWLPRWTGNRPDELITCYAPDVFYRDPAVPHGLHGREALLAYLKKLLARNPAWVWTADEVWPLAGAHGFALRWKAVIPVGATVVHETGLDLVRVEGGLVTRNEVYFDRAGLLAAFARG